MRLEFVDIVSDLPNCTPDVIEVVVESGAERCITVLAALKMRWLVMYTQLRIQAPDCCTACSTVSRALSVESLSRLMSP